MFVKNPNCPKCVEGIMSFKGRLIESPYIDIADMAVTDVVCDNCSYKIENIFDFQFRMSSEQIKSLILKLADGNESGDCSITDVLSRWPMNSCAVVDAFMDLNYGEEK
ncbi:MAG: hypothetical protein ACW98D_18900 [Promethearchaeota archaeon]|jgi:C4-type Zn-finger protein